MVGEGKGAFVHSRLAIIDLSPAGAQPMSTPDGRFVIVFNGELYNYRELREEMEEDGEAFHTRSDTEVLLRLLSREGPDGLLRLDGMFALALFDQVEQTLLLARDPLGEKPLYWAQTKLGVAFASGVKGVLASGLVPRNPDWRALALFLRQGSVPAPWTHALGVSMLPAGTWRRFDLGTGRTEERQFWRLRFLPEAEALRDRRAAVLLLRSVLCESVRLRMRADVPVAAFLSGGLDSAVVAALMKLEGARNLRTFTVVLPGHPADESLKASRLAEHLGADHTVVPLVDGKDDGWLDEALGAMDVPSVDGPNTWLVSRAVRRAGVKVAVSGLGGDELFYGYPSFRTVPPLAASLSCFRLAKAHQQFGRRLLGSRLLNSLLSGRPREGRVIDAMINGGGLEAAWLTRRGLYSEFAARELLPAGFEDAAADINEIALLEDLGMPTGLASRRQISFLESAVYLRDQLLKDSDVMSMAHALELRLPLISRKVVETVATFSDEVLGAGPPKSLLKEAVCELLPRHVGAGTKRGFTLDWQTLLPGSRERRSLDVAYINRKAAQKIWDHWDAGRIGFAYPFALEVLVRAVEAMVCQ